ncbi:PEP-utilizing enzyme [Bradyrhizobium sp. BR 1432]|uniref:PEP-utilizing enzyme n=1 Tax=Bradyrhizobium sp. BR 1432 TaxID=3447966 RepID=UPI003EE7A94A
MPGWPARRSGRRVLPHLRRSQTRLLRTKGRRHLGRHGPRQSSTLAAPARTRAASLHSTTGRSRFGKSHDLADQSAGDLRRRHPERLDLARDRGKPGSRSGRARVCRTLDDAAGLEPGEILVAVRTTPNWTPLFSQVAAIVTDVGAATSHSSIIAREFRIPAVVGTQQATRVVKNGDQVTVDGTAGLVHVELQSL